MSQTVSPSTSRCYGLARVSRAWSVSRAGVYRFLKGAPSPAIARRRPGPIGPCPDADLAIISAGKSKRPTFTAKAIANYGRDCALPGFARALAACAGRWERTACLRPIASGATKRRRTTEPSSPTRSTKCGERTRARPSPSRKGGPMFSSPSNTRTQKSSAFTLRVQPIASRLRGAGAGASRQGVYRCFGIITARRGA